MKYISTRFYLVAVVAALAGALCFAGGRELTKKYESMAAVNFTPHLAELQRMRVLLNGQDNWQQYAKDAGVDAGIARDIKKRLADQGLDKNIAPVMTFSKQDFKEYGDLQKYLKETDKLVAGIQITDRASTPEKAQQSVEVLLKYFLETSWHYQLVDQYATKFEQMRVKLLDARNKQIVLEEDVRKAQDRKSRLIVLNKSYPAPAPNETRLVMNLTNEDDRFLSPAAQLTAVESQLINLNVKLDSLTREQRQLQFYQDIYTAFSKVTIGTSLGSVMHDRLDQALQDQVKAKGALDDTLQEVVNIIQLDLLKIRNQYSNDVKFIARPTLPVSPVGIGSSMAALLGGLLFMLAWVLYYFRVELLAFIKRFMQEDETEPRHAPAAAPADKG